MKGNPKGAVIEKSNAPHPIYQPIWLNIAAPRSQEEAALYYQLSALLHRGEFMRRWRIEKKLDIPLFEAEMQRRRKIEDTN